MIGNTFIATISNLDTNAADANCGCHRWENSKTTTIPTFNAKGNLLSSMIPWTARSGALVRNRCAARMEPTSGVGFTESSSDRHPQRQCLHPVSGFQIAQPSYHEANYKYTADHCLDRDELDRFCKFLDSQRHFQTCDSVQREIAICLKWIREYQDGRSLTQSSIKSEVPSLTEGLSNISTLSTDVMATRIDQGQIHYAYNPTVDSSCQEIGTMTQDSSVVGLEYLECHLNFGP